MINELPYVPVIAISNYTSWHELSIGLYKYALNQQITNYNQCGIYLIYNFNNRLYYIGSTGSFNKRCSIHYKELCLGVHYNYRLQRDWNKYGKRVFKFIPLEVVKWEDLEKREQYWMDRTNPPYNIRKKAERPKENSFQIEKEIRERCRIPSVISKEESLNLPY